MNKLEKIHADNTNLTAPYALLSTKGGFEPVTSVIAAAEITEKIAIEFAGWMGSNYFTQNDNEKWCSELLHYSGCSYSTEELFQEFLKTKQ